MDTKEEFKKVNEIVLSLLRTNERCRNDDKFLTYLVMREFADIYISEESLKKLPAFASIQKIRQKIQNKQDLYPPTIESVKIKRQRRQKEIRDLMR